MRTSGLCLTLLLCMAGKVTLNAQVLVPSPEERNTVAAKPAGKKTAPKNWHHLSFSKDSVYGIESEKAYAAFPKSKKKNKVIVAIMDSGVDTAHADLKNMLWYNKKEIAGNGKDDDKNGYVDDIHGWNFLGSKDGRVNVVKTNLEADREYVLLKEKYSGFTLNEYLKAPEYAYLRSVVSRSALGGKEMAVEVAKALDTAGKKLIEKLQQQNPGKILRLSDFGRYKAVDSMEIYAQSALMTMTAFNKVSDTSLLLSLAPRFFTNMVASNSKEYEAARKNTTDSRSQMNDDFRQNTDPYYGNNILFLPHADHGTHVTGIIGAERGNNTGMDGIADNVALMAVRVVPDGDEYDKDIANGIRYAVDNGAKIINMSFGKPFSPQKQWVDEAIRYAEQKGVLIIKGAGNDTQDSDKQGNFPNALFADGTKAKNLINVGASTPAGKAARFSNYGQTSVDIFAPGTEIYSTVPDNGYQVKEGTSMACPVVAGVAALVWSRYPRLTYSQVKDILLRSATKVTGTTPVPGAQTPTQAPFSQLSVTGGIVNAYEALKLAKTYK